METEVRFPMNRLNATILALLAAMAVGACGEKANDNDTNDPRPAAIATLQASMRSPEAPIGTRSPSSDPTSSTSIPTARPTQAPTDDPALDPGILTRAGVNLSDMPAGWVGGEMLSESPGPGSDENDFCGGVSGIRAKNQATWTFAKGFLEQVAVQSALLFPSSKEAAQAMDSARKAFNACGSTWSAADEPQTVWSVSGLTVKKVGDESFGKRFRTSDPTTGPTQIDLMIFRKGPVVEVLAHLTLGIPATESPLETMSEAASNRLVGMGIK